MTAERPDVARERFVAPRSSPGSGLVVQLGAAFHWTPATFILLGRDRRAAGAPGGRAVPGRSLAKHAGQRGVVRRAPQSGGSTTARLGPADLLGRARRGLSPRCCEFPAAMPVSLILRARSSPTGRTRRSVATPATPSIFPQQTLVGFTHQEMSEGKFCGRCHDGRTAFAIPGTACAQVPRRCPLAARWGACSCGRRSDSASSRAPRAPRKQSAGTFSTSSGSRRSRPPHPPGQPGRPPASQRQGSPNPEGPGGKAKSGGRTAPPAGPSFTRAIHPLFLAHLQGLPHRGRRGGRHAPRLDGRRGGQSPRVGAAC